MDNQIAYDELEKESKEAMDAATWLTDNEDKIKTLVMSPYDLLYTDSAMEQSDLIEEMREAMYYMGTVLNYIGKYAT